MRHSTNCLYMCWSMPRLGYVSCGCNMGRDLMYLILQPVHSMNGKSTKYFDSSYVEDAIEASRALEMPGVVVYKLDALTRLEKITFIKQEFEAA